MSVAIEYITIGNKLFKIFKISVKYMTKV